MGKFQDQGAAEQQEGKRVLAAFVPDPQAAIAVQPGPGALGYPAVAPLALTGVGLPLDNAQRNATAAQSRAGTGAPCRHEACPAAAGAPAAAEWAGWRRPAVRAGRSLDVGCRGQGGKGAARALYDAMTLGARLAAVGELRPRRGAPVRAWTLALSTRAGPSLRSA